MTMNKYELALVINAKIEDDARTDAIEKIKALIEKFGGEITNVDEWGKKKLAYEIQKMNRMQILSTVLLLADKVNLLRSI